MYLVLLAALTAVCSADKLDRTYLPPATAKTAGGSSRSLLLPVSDSFEGPAGSYINDAQGVVVDAAAPGTRASLSAEESGLGAPRDTYGSTASKVGDAAFKTIITGFSRSPTLLKSIPLEDQDPAYQTSIPKEQAIQTKLLQLNSPTDHNSNVLTYENNVDIHKYNYGFQSDNGIAVGETGVAHDGVQAQGGYSYKGDDGKVYKVTYTAGKHGYQPQGDHLPKSPPVPEDIQKSIEQNNKDKASGIVDDGSYDPQKYDAESDYKESDSNKYNDKQQSQFEKRPEFNAPANGASIVQNNLPASGLTGNTGLAPAYSVTTALPNVFSSQSKPSSSFGQGLQGGSAGFGQSVFGSSFNSEAQSTGFGTQYPQQGLKPQFGEPQLSQFGANPTIQPGQFGSQFNSQTFQKPELNSASGAISSQYNKVDQKFSNIQSSNQYSQGFQDSQINLSSSDKLSQAKPIISTDGVNSKPFDSSFYSTPNSFGQIGQTESVNNAYLPPSSNTINEKPFQGPPPKETGILSTPASLLQKPEVFNVNKQPYNIQFSVPTQTTNNQVPSTQAQATFNQDGQRYPQLSGSQDLQQTKPVIGTQSPSSSGSLSTLAGTNKFSSGVTTANSQVSQLSSNAPVTSQSFTPTSPSFTPSNSPNYKPYSGLFNTPTKLPYQSTAATQSTNYQFLSSQGQASLSQNAQKYPQFSASPDFQQQKPIAGTQSPSSSSFTTLTGTNQSPFGVTTTTGQVSKFPSDTSVTTQSFSPTSPSFTSSIPPKYKPFSGLSNTPTKLPYQSTPATQSNNYQFSSSQGQASLSQNAQKYPQFSASPDFQQQKPIAGTQSPSSSSFSTLTGTNQSSFGVTTATGQVSKFPSDSSVTTQSFSPTSPSFTSSNPPNYKPLSGLSNTPTKLPYQSTPATQSNYYQFSSSQGQASLSQNAQKYPQFSASPDFQQQKPIAGTQSPSSSSVSTLTGTNQSPFGVTTATGQVSKFPSDSSVTTQSFSPTSPSFTSSNPPNYKPLSGLYNAPTKLPYQQSSNIQSNAPTQSTNYQFSSLHGQKPLNEGNEQYSQLNVSPDFQQKKPIAGTQSPSSSSLLTLAETNQSPSGDTASSGQVSQFGSHFSQTPVTTQSISPTSPSFSSSSSPNNKPAFGTSNTPSQLPYLQSSHIQQNTFAQSTNQFPSSQGQVPLNQGSPKYPEYSGLQDFQQKKPISGTQFPSGISSSSTLTGTSQPPYEVSTLSGQVSQFGSNTPVITQTSPTSPSFTPSNPPNYKPFIGVSNTQTQPLELLSQQVAEKDKFVQSTISSEQKLQSNLPQSKPSITQNVFSTQLPVASQQPQDVNPAYYYSQPAKPFSTPATRPQVASTPLSNFDQYIQSKQPSYVSVTPVTPTSLPSQFPTLSTLSQQKPVQQSFSQSTTVQKPTTSEVSYNTNTAQVDNKPSAVFQNYTPQPTQEHTGELYDYKKPAQEYSPSTSKDSSTQLGQIQTGVVSIQETTSNLETTKPQASQVPLPQQQTSLSLNTPTTSQEQSKPGLSQFGTQSYKPFQSTTQFQSQPLKPFTTTTQFGTQPLKPYGGTSQSGTQTYKPFGSTSQFGTQSYKPFGTTTQFGTQPVKTAGSSGQFGTQPVKPFGSTSQFGSQPTKPFGSTSQSGTQSYKPFGSTYKPFGSTSSYSSQPAKPQQQQSFLGQSQTGTVFSTQSESQPTKAIGSVPSTLTSQSQTEVETTKPQLSQQSQSITTQEQQTTLQHFGTETKPSLGQSYVTTSNNQQQSVSQTQFTPQTNKPLGPLFSTSQPQIGQQTTKPQTQSLVQGQNINTGTDYTSQLGTQPQISKPVPGNTQAISSQVQATGSQYSFIQPVKPVTAIQTGIQQQLGTETKPSLGQSYLTNSNNQQQSQTQFTAQSYKPFGTGYPTSGSSLAQTQFGSEATKPQETSKKQEHLSAGDFNTFSSSQTVQGTTQATNSQSTKTQFGGVTATQTQQHQSTKYELTAQTKPQFPQTIVNNQQQTSVNKAFGSQSYNQFKSSTPYNFGTQQTKNQFGQYTFPKFGGSHATASASSQAFPSFHFGSQPFGNTYQSAFKSQFGQSFPPSHNTAFSSATNGPELYKYNKPTPKPFTSFSFQPLKQFGTASTPVGFSTVQPTTPSYSQKLTGFDSSSQASIIPQSSHSKPQLTTSSIPSFGSTATPLLQTAQSVGLQGTLKPKEETIKGEKFSVSKQPARFDEKTGYHY